jgi:hypothetical protein
MSNDTKFTWGDLKKVINKLPEEELNKEVIVWNEESGCRITEVEILNEDYYQDEECCIPESELKHILKEEGETMDTHPLVLKKGSAVLFGV